MKRNLIYIILWAAIFVQFTMLCLTINRYISARITPDYTEANRINKLVDGEHVNKIAIIGTTSQPPITEYDLLRVQGRSGPFLIIKADGTIYIAKKCVDGTVISEAQCVAFFQKAFAPAFPSQLQ